MTVNPTNKAEKYGDAQTYPILHGSTYIQATNVAKPGVSLLI